MKGQEPSVTVLTSVIKNAYDKDMFINDELFMSYMNNQKENFHQIRSTRRRIFLTDIIGKLDKQYVIESLSNAFFEDDEDLSNDEYFENALNKIKKRQQNFTREFFILCLLINGKNNWAEIDDMLSMEYINYPELNPNVVFDACVIESCEYYKRTKGKISAYERFCENTQFLKYKCPLYFAYDD